MMDEFERETTTDLTAAGNNGGISYNNSPGNWQAIKASIQE